MPEGKKHGKLSEVVKHDGLKSGEERLLRVRGLRVTVPTKKGEIRELVKGIHLSLKKGEIVGIAGESGSGKSMTALSIMGLLPEPICYNVDQMEFEGDNLNRLLGRKKTLRDTLLGKDMAMIYQEPMTSLNPLLTIEQQLREALLCHSTCDNGETEQRLWAVLLEVSLTPSEVLPCYPHELSGGMRQRVMIAMAMLHKPKLLIADEPTTALDADTEKEILPIIYRLSKENNTAVLLISHNLNLLRSMCDRILVMKDGIVIERGETEQIFTSPKKEYTKQLIEAVVSGKKTEENRSLFKKKPLLTVNDLSVSYQVQKHLLKRPEKKQIVEDVSFHLYQEEIFGLIGPSGCGKSTILNAVSGLHRDYKGTVLINREAEEKEKSSSRRGNIVQMVFQDPYTSLNPAKKVSFILEEPLRLNSKLSKEERKMRVLQMLQETELPEEFADRYVAELSGGQRQRVAIAAALISNPRLILLDEPVSALDVTVQAQILALLLSLQKKHHLTYLFVSHDMAVVRKICDRVAVMKEGKLVAIGETEKIYSSFGLEKEKQKIFD